MTAKKPNHIKRPADKLIKKSASLYKSLNGGLEHQELEAIIADSNDAIVVYTLGKKIMSWNKGAHLLYGYTKKEALTMRLRDLVAKDCWKESLTSLENISQGVPVKLFETRHITKNGRILYVWVSISMLVNYRGETGAFVMTVRDFTEQKMLIESNQYLAQEIIRAQEEERKRIAQGIHDDLGQSLVALKMFLLANASDVVNESPILKEKVGEMQKNIDDIIDKARRLSHELLPPNLKYIGLPGAINGLIKMYKANKNISIRFVQRNLRNVNLESADIILYRIIQESLNNIVKHAKATLVVINLSYKKGTLTLTISDNGKGLRLPVKRAKGQGVGIAIMNERARLINAVLSFASEPNKGTKVMVTLTIDKKKAL